MAKINLKESDLLTKMGEMGAHERAFNLSDWTCQMVIEGAIRGIATALSFLKNKEHPVAICIEDFQRDRSGNGIPRKKLLSMIATYMQDEEDEEISNWQVAMTLDEKDIPENAQIITIDDGGVTSNIAGECEKHFNFKFTSKEAMLDLLTIFSLSLWNWLDENAKEGETTTLESDIFTASVSIEDGIKYFAITPGAEIKKIVAKTEND